MEISRATVSRVSLCIIPVNPRTASKWFGTKEMHAHKEDICNRLYRGREANGQARKLALLESLDCVDSCVERKLSTL